MYNDNVFYYVQKTTEDAEKMCLMQANVISSSIRLFLG